jgi:hypothetical protein
MRGAVLVETVVYKIKARYEIRSGLSLFEKFVIPYYGGELSARPRNRTLQCSKI